MHTAFALREHLPSITKSSARETFAAGSFSFKDERWRFNVLVEGFSGARKTALGVGTIVEFHRDIEHHKVRGGDASA